MRASFGRNRQGLCAAGTCCCSCGSSGSCPFLSLFSCLSTSPSALSKVRGCSMHRISRQPVGVADPCGQRLGRRRTLPNLWPRFRRSTISAPCKKAPKAYCCCAHALLLSAAAPCHVLWTSTREQLLGPCVLGFIRAHMDNNPSHAGTVTDARVPFCRLL